jgi:hypothetical protein
MPVTRILLLALTWTALATVLAPPLQAQKKGGGIEKFEEVDPYTQGDPEKTAKLGYSQVGSFGWADGDRTEQIQATMGGLDFLWVETEHFRIGSSLGTYKIPNDRNEKEKLKAEFKVIKERLGRFKAPKRELDPWMRLHLYALRAEALYDQFVADFDLGSLADDQEKPYLGHPKKFLLLITQRKSELGRYLRVYEKTENEVSFGGGRPDAQMLFALNAEVIETAYTDPIDEPFDSMLHCRVIAGLTRNFINGFNGKLFQSSAWLSRGAAHYYARQCDPRWVLAGPTEVPVDDKHWRWEDRVKGLLKKDFFATMADMVQWTDGYEMSVRDHMVIASKIEYLVTEAKGDLSEFLSDMVTPIIGMTAGSAEELKKRQEMALMVNFDLRPEELDKKWKKWALKR